MGQKKCKVCLPIVITTGEISQYVLPKRMGCIICIHI